MHRYELCMSVKQISSESLLGHAARSRPHVTSYMLIIAHRGEEKNRILITAVSCERRTVCIFPNRRFERHLANQTSGINIF